MIMGSSPHTRGARRRRRTIGTFRRIIPAYAGSTALPRRSVPPEPDHPRIRGEHLNRIKQELPSEGSSPHTRGAPQEVSDDTESRGIIPAYAGSTAAQRYLFGAVGDHPRIRGEHIPITDGGRGRDGSSPHTRGAQPLSPSLIIRARIIPAYAGSTTTSPPSSAPAADHPRIRGEHDASGIQGPFDAGSSPHTRGARRRGLSPCGVLGIIPAYAGSTGLKWLTSKLTSDHPRIRGEHRRGLVSVALALGSSPHTRGAPGRS